ncbi:ras-related protein Rab-7a-like [Heptranchias perlo]|uniref:ras-related protein Rab-7a-like n=1 Tax=Heptranchias perlo TaxID=212740 RepID=UPI00355A9E9B
MSMRKRIHLKVVLLGNSGVGKSALMNQYINKHYTNLYKATIGADFLTKDIVSDNKNVTLQVWDTAGTERFQSLGSVLYRGTDCCLLVFDVTSTASFRALEGWRQEFVLQAAPRDPDGFPFVVVGNKTDLRNREVTVKHVEEWCKPHNLPYFETSAKEDLNVEEAFRAAVKVALKKLRSEDQYVDCLDHVQLSPVHRAKTQEHCEC